MTKHTSFKPYNYLISACFFYGLVLRYRFHAEPLGQDSFGYADTIDVITEEKGNVWWFHDILSIIGQYPYSAPSGWTLFWSSVKLITGLNTIDLIYLSSITLYSLIFVAAFSLSNLFFRSKMLVIVLTIGYAMNPIVLWETFFTISLRIPSLSFAILLLLVIILNQNKNSYSLNLIIIVLALTSLTLHKISMSFLIFLIIFRLILFAYEYNLFSRRLKYIFTIFPSLMFLFTILLPEISFGYIVPKSGEFYDQSISSRFISYIIHYGTLLTYL